MTTVNMPNPPDQPTTQVGDTGVDAQSAPGAAPTTEESAPLPLGADMARIIEAQTDVIAQKQFYHSQLLLGVSALGTDIVSARASALQVAAALRAGDPHPIDHTLVNLGEPQYAQVNDRTLPYRFNSQIAGLLEGIILDTITQAYRDDAARMREARALLEEIFSGANESLMTMTKSPPMFQAPAMGPDPKMLSAPESAK